MYILALYLYHVVLIGYSRILPSTMTVSIQRDEVGTFVLSSPFSSVVMFLTFLEAKY